MPENYRNRALKQIMEYEQSPMTPEADDIVKKFFDITQPYRIKDVVKALSEIQIDVIRSAEIALEMMDERASANKQKTEMIISVMLGNL